uniref:RloB-like protein n=1 Tax=Candidatus Kentrum sp. SD TaxID=2126332 RepID=A0A450Z4E2_9GAMM|nr:MAG: RloB-like protein [Candidatus Kentron sp. SD]VFK48670.1 MAG: RloB-like protein [Candidatus Kentron sp. SD]
MGKRRLRETTRRQRLAPNSGYGYVLIVCEGKKTEPHYFKELREQYQLSSVNVEVTSADGTDPVSVVRTAKSKREEAKKREKPFDRVYCVFDRDEHANFDEASRQITKRQKQGFRTARSWPCFEFWLLLHFRYTRQPFQRDGRRTAAQNCESALKSEMENYRKGKKGVFTELLPQLEEAKANAARALQDAKATGEYNSATEIHELVDYLQTSSARKEKSIGRRT